MGGELNPVQTEEYVQKIAKCNQVLFDLALDNEHRE